MKEESVENLRITNYNQRDKTISITDGINTETIPIITPNEMPLNVFSNSEQPGQELKKPEFPGASNNKQEESRKRFREDELFS